MNDTQTQNRISQTMWLDASLLWRYHPATVSIDTLNKLFYTTTSAVLSLQDLSCTFTLIGPPMVQAQQAAWQQHHFVSLSGSGEPTQYVHHDQRQAPECNGQVTATGLQGKWVHPWSLVVLQSITDLVDSVSKSNKQWEDNGRLMEVFPGVLERFMHTSLCRWCPGCGPEYCMHQTVTRSLIPSFVSHPHSLFLLLAHSANSLTLFIKYQHK